jgi:hypothetical protein
MSGVSRATDGGADANAGPVDDDDRELEAALRGVIEERLAGLGDAERNDAMLAALAAAADGGAVDGPRWHRRRGQRGRRGLRGARVMREVGIDFLQTRVWVGSLEVAEPMVRGADVLRMDRCGRRYRHRHPQRERSVRRTVRWRRSYVAGYL